MLNLSNFHLYIIFLFLTFLHQSFITEILTAQDYKHFESLKKTTDIYKQTRAKPGAALQTALLLIV